MLTLLAEKSPLSVHKRRSQSHKDRGDTGLLGMQDHNTPVNGFL